MLVVSLISGEVLVLEPETLKTRRSFHAPDPHVCCAVASANGEVIAMKDTDTSFSCWDLVTGSRLRRFGVDQRGFVQIGPMALSCDGKMVATAHSSHYSDSVGVVTTWDVVSGSTLRVFHNFINFPMELAFSPNGSFLVCSDHTGECSEFCLTGASFMTRHIHSGQSKRSNMTAVAWDPYSQLYLCGHVDGSILTVESAGCVSEPTPNDTPPTSYFAYSNRGDSVFTLAISSDNAYVAVAGGRGLEETYNSTAKPTETPSETPSDKPTHKPSTETRVVGFVAIYQPRGKGLCWKRWVKPGDDGNILSVSFSLDNRFLASGGGDGVCRIWDVSDGTIVNKINLHNSVIYLSFVFDIEEQQKRRMAIAMSGHARLGTGSALQDVPDDLLNKLIMMTS